MYKCTYHMIPNNNTDILDPKDRLYHTTLPNFPPVASAKQLQTQLFSLRIRAILKLQGLQVSQKHIIISPPWQQKILSSTIAATGRQLKQSVNVFHNLILYRRLPT